MGRRLSVERIANVLKIITVSGGATFTELMRATGIPRASLARYIKYLEKKRYIRKKRGKWVPTSKSGGEAVTEEDILKILCIIAYSVVREQGDLAVVREVCRKVM